MAKTDSESTQPIPTNIADLKKLIREVIEEEKIKAYKNAKQRDKTMSK